MAVLPPVTLEDRYTQSTGEILLTGVQALVRLPLLQRQLDHRAGLDTAGFISGYRGSPLGGLDQALWKAEAHLAAHDIVFKPGLNEDLAATAVWGSQQLHLSPGARKQGVFGLWYGKGPGVDRSLDALRHANAAGSSRYGGVLAVAGDDHACKSSSLPHQSEPSLIAAMIPVLHAGSVQEVLEYGLAGWALSRFAGCWTGLKLVSDVADATRRVPAALPAAGFIQPEGFDDLSLRWPDPPIDQERRLIEQKLPAVLAFVRANQLNHSPLTSAQPRFGIIATGKAYYDVRQALAELQLSEAQCAALGLSLFKVAMPWPLEPEGIRAFAARQQVVLVVEEKRGIIEPQLKDILSSLPASARPAVLGKRDLAGAPLLPETGELSVLRLALIIAQQLQTLGADLKMPELAAREPAQLADLIERKPHYCSGCPHNTSTTVPEGSRALAGIGCHYMALWMERRTETFSQMGGEGVAWIGTAPFTTEAHVFANLGDGTYFHSGLLAIRAAVAGAVNITYKILFNDAVAMTGGQPVDGQLSVPQLTQQVHAEGVRAIFVVTDEPKKYGRKAGFAPGCIIAHRDDFEAIQHKCRTLTGVSVIVYDQTCAAEKRRRRKRGTYPDPARRVMINDLVCEGCGDCSVKSNCLSIVPQETEYGRKRSIDQSSCNKDFSCLKGFCPSFVTIEGGALHKPDLPTLATLPPPPAVTQPSLERPWRLLVTGIGGTGIVTVGAVLAMAAHLEGKAVSVLDQTGLAQKGGAVFSHIQLATDAQALAAPRLTAGAADAVIAGDLVVSASREGLAYLRAGHTHAILNTQETITAHFTRDATSTLPQAGMVARLQAQCGAVTPAPATQLASALFGDTVAANMFLLGCAWQSGLVPLAPESIAHALRMNGAQVEMNITAFTAGRCFIATPEAVLALARPAALPPAHHALSHTLEEMIARRADFLRNYQNSAYAARYMGLLEKVRAAEAAVQPQSTELTQAVARSLFKLMAYKDEYEVARLHSEGTFLAQLRASFSGNYRLRYHLAPPLLARRDPVTSEPRKISFGGWILPLFAVLAKLKVLRGTPFDIFGYTHERRTERLLIAEYEALLTTLLGALTPATHSRCVALAALAQNIRGYGPIKAKSIAEVASTQARLLGELRG